MLSAFHRKERTTKFWSINYKPLQVCPWKQPYWSVNTFTFTTALDSNNQCVKLAVQGFFSYFFEGLGEGTEAKGVAMVTKIFDFSSGTTIYFQFSTWTSLLSSVSHSAAPTRLQSPVTALAGPLGSCIKRGLHFLLHLKAPLLLSSSSRHRLLFPFSANFLERFHSLSCPLVMCWASQSPSSSRIFSPQPLWLPGALTLQATTSTSTPSSRTPPTLILFLLLSHLGSLCSWPHPPKWVFSAVLGSSLLLGLSSPHTPVPWTLLDTTTVSNVLNVKKHPSVLVSVAHLLRISLNWFPNPIPPTTRGFYLSLPFR